MSGLTQGLNVRGGTLMQELNPDTTPAQVASHTVLFDVGIARALAWDVGLSRAAPEDVGIARALAWDTSLASVAAEGVGIIRVSVGEVEQ